MADLTPQAALVMRPAVADDETAVAQLIRTRSVWMREHGQPDWNDAADDLAAQTANPDIPVRVLTTIDGEIIGCTTLFDESPAWFWTAEERARVCTGRDGADLYEGVLRSASDGLSASRG